MIKPGSLRDHLVAKVPELARDAVADMAAAGQDHDQRDPRGPRLGDAGGHRPVPQQLDVDEAAEAAIEGIALRPPAMTGEGGGEVFVVVQGRRHRPAEIEIRPGLQRRPASSPDRAHEVAVDIQRDH